MIFLTLVLLVWLTYGFIVQMKRRLFDKVTFVNKVVWITGASSGIGEALVYKINQLGAKVIISARRTEELERVKKACQNPDKVIIHPMDMSDPEKTEANVTKFLADNKDLPIDILINNAGISMRVSFLENDLVSDTKLMNLNLLSQIAITRPVVQRMVKAGSGQVANIGSIASKIATPYRTTYAASKHALVGYFDSLRAELYDKNITVTNILPGYIKTNLSHAAIGGKGGVAFGKDDPNQLHGMPADAFAEKAAAAIYFKENEVIITSKFLHHIANVMRTIWPDSVFYYLRSVYKKEMQKIVNYEKKTE